MDTRCDECGDTGIILTPNYVINCECKGTK